MANLYARRTALSNVAGRINYVDRDARKYKSTKEDLLAKYDGAAELLQGNYWKILAKECQAAWETYGPANKVKVNRKGKEVPLKAREGQELVIQLSNSLLDRMAPAEIAAALGEAFQQYTGQPCHVAIHWNQKKNNHHAHLIYAERHLLQEQETKVAERNLFFDEQGKRRYKKAEILDEAGQLREGCRIIKKGEIYSQRAFGSVDQAMGTREWLAQLKTEWLLPLLNGPLKGDLEYQEYDPSTGKLPQQHVDKGFSEETAAAVEEKNRKVREYNHWLDQIQLDQEVARMAAAEIRGAEYDLTLLQTLIDIMRMSVDPEYTASWVKSDTGELAKLDAMIEDRFDDPFGQADWGVQRTLDFIAVARIRNIGDAQSVEDARRQIGQELAAARARGDERAAAQAKKEYAAVAEQQRKPGFDDLLAGAEARQKAQKKGGANSLEVRRNTR